MQSAATDLPELDSISRRLLPVRGKHLSQQLNLLVSFAQQNDTLLIEGPSGSGKSRLARWLHHMSGRRLQAYELVDLSTIPEDMQLANLFGWKKGAFTGAYQDTCGAIERAESGILFIDEINKLSMKAQAGLLQLLDSGHYSPLGAAQSARIANVRFICGSNESLSELVEQGRFREDLYYRINVLPINLPSLDSRRDEIVPWTKYMMDRRHGEMSAAQSYYLEPEALSYLACQSWPGNLRQLDNVVRRAYALASISGPREQLILSREHFSQAFNMDRKQQTNKLSSLMWRTAEAIVLEAEKRQIGGSVLAFDGIGSLKGYAMACALKKYRDKKAVCRLFGKEKSLANRTYQREIRREIENLVKFEQDLGAENYFDWSQLIETN